jgi:4Fe-4S ferredoxin
LACPKEAITIGKQPKNLVEKAQKPVVDVDLSKCNFCGVCDVLCPYGAIRVTVDGEHALSILEKQSFPKIVRGIKVNPEKFPSDLKKIESICPLNLIQVKYSLSDGGIARNASSSTDEQQALKVSVEVDVDHCPCCGICEAKLPPGAISVHKMFSGKLSINSEKCPKGCTDCLDVCPITGTLYLSDNDKKVHANEMSCVYCGACKIVCPVDEALVFERTHINHEPVRSGAWNKALERLTSPTEMSKELKAKGSFKTRDSVMKRMGVKGEQHV